jgi:hypothetical protein
MGPPNPHEDEKNVVVGWGWVGGPACAAVDLAWLAGQVPMGPGGDVSGQSVPLEHWHI